MYQKMIIAGYLGRDPEMRFTPSGQAVTDFSIATSRTYPGADGTQKKETTWFKVTAWGKLAEITNEHLKKGSKVLVEGRLVSDPQTGGPKVFKRQDGSSGASFEVTAQEVRFLSSKNEESGGGHSGGSGAVGGGTTADDEIPF